MRIVYGVFALIAASFLLVSHRSDVALSDNGRAGVTASPGETGCNASGCHTGVGSGTIDLTTNIPAGGFVPGGTYDVSVTVSDMGRSLFGMGFEALTSGNANAGTLAITNAAETQLKAKTVGGVSRQNVVHQLNGGVAPNSKTFSFRWTAPTTAAGNVTFYYAGIAANGDGAEDPGDNAYASSRVFSPQAVAVCPTFTAAPANVSIANSQCGNNCITTNGSITAPTGTPCPTGSSLQYSVNGGAWTSNLPTYTATAQSIQTRCGCNSDATQNSAASVAVTTLPASCDLPTAPTLTIVNNVLPSTVGSISATGCGAGTIVEYATSPTGTFSATAPTYTLSPITVYARCRNTTTGCFSALATATTAPNAPSVITLNCPTNIAITAATGATTAIATFTAPVGSSTCAAGSVTTVQTSGLASGSAFPIGTSQVCYTATDGCGVSKSCCFSVVVTSGQTATECNGIKVQDDENAIKIYKLPRLSTIQPEIRVINTLTNQVVFQCTACNARKGSLKIKNIPLGTYRVEIDLYQTIGGVRTLLCQKSATVTVEEEDDDDDDDHDLYLNCQPKVTVTAAIGATSAVATFMEPIGTSNCPTGTVTTSHTSGLVSGSAFPIGKTDVCYRAVDGCGNTKTCCIEVEVKAAYNATNCSRIEIKGEDNKIKIEKLPNQSQVQTEVRVINTATNQTVFQCANNCNVQGDELAIRNIARGSYRVEIDIYQTVSGVRTLMCQRSATVTVDEDNDFSSNPTDVTMLENTEGVVSAENDMAVVYAPNPIKSVKKTTILLYPNPANDRLTVSLSAFNGQSATIQIFNPLGQLVKSKLVENTQTAPVELSLEGMTAGFYTLTVQSDSGRIAHRFIIQK